MKYYFTGDSHYGHGNVIKYANRPFKDVEEMDRIMIERWNSIVKPEDVIYHLGDISFYKPDQSFKILSRLMGRKHWIFGNHDKYLRKDKRILDLFESTSELKEIKIPDSSLELGAQSIVLCHYAMRVWNRSHHGTWHLYGHSHGSLPDDRNSLSIDVGVDTCNYTPISYEEIKKVMAHKTFVPIDHHGRKDI